ncbi:MAG: hypothetical protein LBJ02_10490, partial [Bifidobacteriaceae bacterium]|nr:hypothetical protein [Bifidobacteriaceae bacterium]
DTLRGGGGQDTYDLAGGGMDKIYDQGTSYVVLMPGDVTPDQVVPSRSGNWLVLSYPGGSLSIEYWFASSSYKFGELRFSDEQQTTWTPADVR